MPFAAVLRYPMSKPMPPESVVRQGRREAKLGASLTDLTLRDCDGAAAGQPVTPMPSHRTRGSNGLMNQRVLVTGGAGFVGSHIVDLLVEAGCDEIIALDNMARGRRENLASASSSGKVRLVDGDIRDEPLLRELVE